MHFSWLKTEKSKWCQFFFAAGKFKYSLERVVWHYRVITDQATHLTQKKHEAWVPTMINTFKRCLLTKSKEWIVTHGSVTLEPTQRYLQYAQSVSPVDTLTIPHQEASVSPGPCEQFLGRSSTQVPVIPHRRRGPQRRNPTSTSTTPGHGHSPSHRVQHSNCFPTSPSIQFASRREKYTGDNSCVRQRKAVNKSRTQLTLKSEKSQSRSYKRSRSWELWCCAVCVCSSSSWKTHHPPLSFPSPTEIRVCKSTLDSGEKQRGRLASKCTMVT